MVQLHKRFTDSQVKGLIDRYLKAQVQREYIQQVLGIRKTRFFALPKEYRKDANEFSIQYSKEIKTRTIPQAL